MDGMIGRITQRLKPDDILFVLSDHGFKPFKRGVNLNTWLLKNGYLHLKTGSHSGEWFEGVDWDRTKAYAFGLSGVYINLKGREAKGTVEPREAAALKQELIDKLAGAVDDGTGEKAITAIYDAEKIYSGPYIENGPDLVIGYKPGYRTSWDSVTGKIADRVFADNEKAWSADHCMDHRSVPGVLFCNRKLSAENPGIEDLAPTALDLFGIRAPAQMDGKTLRLSLLPLPHGEGKGDGNPKTGD
jgi:predicted AlkP superfamily phosphohydrolase/phosphomutase